MKQVKIFIGKNRHLKIVTLLAKFAEKYLRSYYNEDFYDFTRNGEAFVLEAFARWMNGRKCRVWDVGANHGQWAREAHRFLPDAQITSFEIVPELAEQIAREASHTDWWRVEQTGLSNRAGNVEVIWNRSADATSAVSPDLDDLLFANSKLERIICPVTKLDDYWVREGVAPHLLKIDAEGHDWAILEGADSLLSNEKAPSILQFEYGRTWIGAQRMLGPVQRRLESLGFSVGRLYPNFVDFRPFSPAQEHFRMGNIIAVRDARLRAMLERFPGNASLRGGT